MTLPFQFRKSAGNTTLDSHQQLFSEGPFRILCWALAWSSCLLTPWFLLVLLNIFLSISLWVLLCLCHNVSEYSVPLSLLIYWGSMLYLCLQLHTVHSAPGWPGPAATHQVQCSQLTCACNYILCSVPQDTCACSSQSLELDCVSTGLIYWTFPWFLRFSIDLITFLLLSFISWCGKQHLHPSS